MGGRPPAPIYRYAAGKKDRWPNHMENFLECVRTAQSLVAMRIEAFIETATLLMSVESYRRKRQVRLGSQAGRDRLTPPPRRSDAHLLAGNPALEIAAARIEPTPADKGPRRATNNITLGSSIRIRTLCPQRIGSSSETLRSTASRTKAADRICTQQEHDKTSH